MGTGDLRDAGSGNALSIVPDKWRRPPKALRNQAVLVVN
jgi:hypothetical protein